MDQSKQGTTICPICATHLSYPIGSLMILCPVCNNSLSPPSSSPTAAAAPAPITATTPVVSNTPQARCIGCRSLLAYPPNALYIQCPSCFQTMSTQPAGNQVFLGTQSSGAMPASKKRKDPNAPKAVTNAYMMFCKTRRGELKAKHPELAFGKIGAKLGEIWRNMSAEEKKPYELKATHDRERYRQEMLSYQAGKMMQMDPEAKKARTSDDGTKEEDLDGKEDEEGEDAEE